MNTGAARVMRRIASVLVALGVWAMPCAAQTPGSPPNATPAETPVKVQDKPAEAAPPEKKPGAIVAAPLDPQWTARLEALSPVEPEAYLKLGEDMSAAAGTPAEVRVARELFVLAYELDRKDVGRHGLMGPACLALADIAPLRQDRRWLLALARAADARYAPPAWKRATAAKASPGVGFAAATTIGQIRSGDAGAARQQLANPEVLEALQAFDGQLSPSGNGVRQLKRWSEQWPCPECRNARVVKLPGSNPPKYRLCSTCEGNPGPKLSRQELVSLLRVESWLMDGEQKTWSAQVAADEGAPLHDPEPVELAPTMGVDPARNVWREGGWKPAAGGK